MKLYRSILILLIAATFACSKKKELSGTKKELSYLRLKNNTTNLLIRGTWKSIGSGYYLEIKEDSVLLHSYTKSFCYKEKNDYLEGLLNTQSQFVLKNDTLSIYLTDYGKETQHLQTKKNYIRIDNLPEKCMSFSQMTNLPEREHFKLYKETLEENYAFAKERDLDWDSIFRKYQDSTFKNRNELFKAMGKIATLTKDQHTKVISENGETMQYRVTPSALTVQKAYKNQNKVKTLNAYFNSFFETNKKNISDSLLSGRGQKVLNGNIEWGKLEGNLGYIHIWSFAGFLNKKFTRLQQIDSIKTEMNKIINELSSTDAIIIDVSFNFGGYDGSALTIASYFTKEPTLAFTSQVFHDGAFFNEDKVFIQPSDIFYTKPVYVVMTDISRSAAEGFAMMMDALPNVTLVGTNTLGTLSGMLGKSINEFYTTYSYQRLVKSGKNYYEVEGVKPDIEKLIFPEEDIMNGHLNTIKDLINLIQENNSH